MIVLPNAVMAILIIAVLASAIAVSRVAFPRSFPLVAVHNGIWIVVLALVGMNLIDYHEFGLAAWLTLVLGLAAFNVGAWAATASASAIPSNGGASSADLPIVGARGLAVLGALYAAGYAAFLVTISSRFGLDTLFNDPESIRGSGDYLASVPMPFRGLLHVGPMLFALLAFPAASRVRIPLLVRVLLLVAIAASLLTLLQRTNLFMGVLLAAALWLSGSEVQKLVGVARRGPRRRPILVAVAAGGVLLAGFQIVGDALGKNESNGLSGSVAPALADTPFTSAYLYLTSGTPAFLGLTQSHNPDWPPEVARGSVAGDYNPQTWGAALAEPALSIFPIIEPWEPIAPFTDVGTRTNVYTWFEPFYRDFRELGVALGAFAIGGCAAYFFSRRHDSARNRWLSALLLAVVIFAPFTQKIHNTLTLLTLGMILILTAGASLEHRRRTRELEALASR